MTRGMGFCVPEPEMNEDRDNDLSSSFDGRRKEKGEEVKGQFDEI